jgi:formate C-acetyltransferase
MEPKIQRGSRIVGMQTKFHFPYYLMPSEYTGLHVTGNVTPDYEKVLSLGLIGIKEQARKRLADLEKNGTGEDGSIPFLKGLIRSLEAGITFSQKYAAALRKKAGQERDPKVKARFERNAEVMEKVPAHPASSFHEAAQSVYFTNLLVWIEGHNLVGLGRFDQYMYPYFEKGMNGGRGSRDEFISILKDFLKAMNRNYPHRSSLLPGDTGQAMTLGGVTLEGEDATNELTCLILDIAGELRQIDPKIVLRVHEKSPDKLLRRGIDTVGKGLGYPLFSNDELIIPAMVRDGYTLRDSRNYCTSACWEPLVPGASFDQNNLGNIIFLHALEAALNHGRSVDDETAVGFDAGGIEDYERFDDLFTAVKDEISFLIREKVEDIQHVRFETSPFLSALMDGCIEKGKDMSTGGCRYNNYGFLSASISNTADALAALKECVFEDRSVPPSRVVPILKSNFDSDPELRARLQFRSAKFGNDEDEVDHIVRDLAEHYARELSRHRNRFGGSHRPGFGSADLYISASRKTAASFDGRGRGEFFSSNFSPAIGAERKGPTAVIQSLLKTDLSRIYNGSVLDMKFSPALFGIDENLDKIAALLKTFISQKGQQLQINVLDTEMLREAQRHPENYRDLVVRVWGFSAYFVDLPKEYQDHLIARSELS